MGDHLEYMQAEEPEPIDCDRFEEHDEEEDEVDKLIDMLGCFS